LLYDEVLADLYIEKTFEKMCLQVITEEVLDERVLQE
jgi:hypothetical protein